METERTVESMERRLHELLGIDRSLNPSERTVLAALLLDPQPATARQLSVVTRSNLQALYSTLDRLEGRGLVVRDSAGPTRTFRAAHPSAVLQELAEPWRRAGELAVGLESPLRELYESGVVRLASASDDRANSIPSLTACLSSLLDRLQGARTEVWVLGSDSPWLTRSTLVEHELRRIRRADPRNRVRLFVRRPTGSPERARAHLRLRRDGVEVRYTGRFSTAAVLVDRRWLFSETDLRRESEPAQQYFRLEAPGFCADLAGVLEEEWDRADSANPSTAPFPAESKASGRPRNRI